MREYVGTVALSAFSILVYAAGVVLTSKYEGVDSLYLLAIPKTVRDMAIYLR